MNIVSERINGLMQKTNKDVYTLSNETGIKVSTLDCYRSLEDIGGIPVRDIIKIANTFIVPVDYLVGRVDFEDINRYKEFYDKFQEKDTIIYEYPYNLLYRILNRPIDYVLTDKMKKGIESILDDVAKTNPNSIYLIREYYQKGRSLTNLAKEIGVTKENIRQKLKKAISILRNPAYSNLMKGIDIVGEYEKKNKSLQEKEYQLNIREERLNKLEKKLLSEYAEKWINYKASFAKYNLKSDVDMALLKQVQRYILDNSEFISFVLNVEFNYIKDVPPLDIRTSNVLLRGGLSGWSEDKRRLVPTVKNILINMPNAKKIRNCGEKTYNKIVEFLLNVFKLPDEKSLYVFRDLIIEMENI